VEIPKCENCGKIAQYKCAVDGNYVCCECARFVPVGKHHMAEPKRPKIKIEVLDKMKQDPKERTILEALEDLTGCPPAEKIDLETEWKPRPR